VVRLDCTAQGRDGRSHLDAIFIRPKYVVFLVVLLICICIWLGTVLFQAAVTADTAERNLHAVYTTSNALALFVEKHERWPNDQTDFEEGIEFPGGIYAWPRDKEEILKRITIVYGISLEDVAKKSANGFDYLTYRQPMYENSARVKIENLLWRVGRVYENQAEKHETSPPEMD